MSRSIKDMTKQKQSEEIANDIAKCCPDGRKTRNRRL